MRRFKTSKWIWYVVLGAVITGLFAPTMVAYGALRPVEEYICPVRVPK